MEYNLRVRKAGLKAYTSPIISVYYYPRDSLIKLFWQMFRYGVGRCRLLRKHKDTLSIFTIIPSIFAAGVMFLAVLLVMVAADLFSLIITFPFICFFIIYTIFVLFQSFILSLRHGLSLLIFLPGIYATIHLGLGMGFLREFFVFSS